MVLGRLRILNLTTLETRFLRADMIEVYKIFKGMDKLDPGRFFDVNVNVNVNVRHTY